MGRLFTALAEERAGTGGPEPQQGLWPPHEALARLLPEAAELEALGV